MREELRVAADSIEKIYAEQGYFFPLQVLSAEAADQLSWQLLRLRDSHGATSLGYG